MNGFKWNWQQKEWPGFYYDENQLKSYEIRFLKKISESLGIVKHFSKSEKDVILIDILSDEAVKTSEIEGEVLNRSSIQESLKRNLGMSYDNRKIRSAEFGISEMMVDQYKHFNKKLKHDTLYNWHKMIASGRRDLIDIGSYRSHEDPMQIVSGRIDKPTVHFQAPPSSAVFNEMVAFISWFNDKHFTDSKTLNTLALSGITHYYFLAIHPFEDGNGRIARVLSEKSISILTGQPSLISLSLTINNSKKDYYENLEYHNTKLDLTKWLIYFSKTVLEALDNSMKIIEFTLKKGKFYDKYSNEMNKRQSKFIERIFREGHQGFTGGLSAINYKRIAKTSASTATRDLNDLIKKGILHKSGQLKGTRYFLNIESL
jgi:Fic family protein